ncbi:MAG: tRNA lysidine(34) synthetase TilS [Parcubacteria group bacterium]
MSKRSSLIKKFQNISHQYDLWKKGDKIVVACSGGSDSACLLDIFAKLQKKYDLELLIAHVNYGLRGKDSDKDEELVRGLAEEYGLKIAALALQRGTTSKIQEANRRSDLHHSENELREIRYSFFEKVRQENKFDLIAVAHNADDQVETFLMRVIRGAGLQGLSAMKYKSGKIIRPLLGISRKEILEHLDKTGRTYRTDKTNKENLFLRNKIRNQLIPYLEKKFNPQIRKTISSAVGSIAEDADLLEKIAEEYCAKKKDLRASEILALHPALQRRIILKAIGKVKKDLKDIEAAHVEEILKALKSTKGKRQIVVFKGLKLTRIGDKVILARNS